MQASTFVIGNEGMDRAGIKESYVTITFEIYSIRRPGYLTSSGR